MSSQILHNSLWKQTWKPTEASKSLGAPKFPQKWVQHHWGQTNCLQVKSRVSGRTHKAQRGQFSMAPLCPLMIRPLTVVSFEKQKTSFVCFCFPALLGKFKDFHVKIQALNLKLDSKLSSFTSNLGTFHFWNLSFGTLETGRNCHLAIKSAAILGAPTFIYLFLQLSWGISWWNLLLKVLTGTFYLNLNLKFCCFLAIGSGTFTETCRINRKQNKHIQGCPKPPQVLCFGRDPKLSALDTKNKFRD